MTEDFFEAVGWGAVILGIAAVIYQQGVLPWFKEWIRRVVREGKEGNGRHDDQHRPRTH